MPYRDLPKIQLEVERRAGMERTGGSAMSGALPFFVHRGTGQEFVLVPGGAFVMGMTAAELVDALVHVVAYDPDTAQHREQLRRIYERANPVHAVSVHPFLCGRSPLLGRTVDASNKGIAWSVHATAEHRGETAAAALRAEDAMRVLQVHGWHLISEAQWEYVARCGGADAWAGGSTFRAAVDRLVEDPRFGSEPSFCNAWGIWGLALGEWVADEWHDGYRGAPAVATPWRREPGPPGTIRGGGVLHAPWQDSIEAMTCHAATRWSSESWRGVFTARPVVPLPWLAFEAPTLKVPVPATFDAAVAGLDPEVREAKRRSQEKDAAREERYQRLDERRRRLEAELPGAVQVGTIRSIGEPGVYIVRLAEANGVLRLPGPDARLAQGTRVRVRVVGEGGVPDLELISVEE